jgi:hypothetical protein
MSRSAAGDKFILQNTTRSKKNIFAANASGVAIPGTKRHWTGAKMLKDFLALVGAYTIARWLYSIWLLFRDDRTGNSGRYRHWEDGDD